jgi:branched-chain amino acid transport system substrate-binding protein
MKFNGLRVLVILMLFTITALGSAAAQNKQLKIGAVLSLTGPASVHGNNILEGLNLAAKDLRQQGWLVEILLEDDGTIPARTVTAVQSLADRGVRLLVGPTWSFLIAAAVPVLERRDLLAYAPAASWEVGGGVSPALLYGTRASSDKEGNFLKWLRAEKIKTLAVLVANSDWAELHIEILKRAAAQAGVTIISTQKHNYGDEESALPALATKIAKSDPDAVFSTGSKEGLAKLARLFEDYKFETQLLGLEDIRDAADDKLLPKSMQHVRLFTLTQPMSPAFIEYFKNEYKRQPGIYSERAYDALIIFSKAVAAVGDSPQAVRDYLRAKDFSYEGFQGVYNFADKGNTQAGEYQLSEILVNEQGGYLLRSLP